MLSKEDIKLLKGMFQEHTGLFRRELVKNHDVLRKDIIREVRDEMHALNRVLEKRFSNQIENLEIRLTNTIEQVSISVGELIDTSILSQLNAQDKRITQIETKLKLA